MNPQDFNLVQPTNTTGGKKNNTKLFIIIGVAVFVLIGIIAAIASPAGPDAIAKKYADACVDFDAAKIVKLMHPKYIDYLEKDLDEDYKDVTEALEAVFDDADDLEIKSYKIDEEFKEYKDEELSLITATMKTTFDIEPDTVKSVRHYTIEFTAIYDGEEDTEDAELLLIQVDNRWYIFGDNFVINEIE